jgi:hypothetical protein
MQLKIDCNNKDFNLKKDLEEYNKKLFERYSYHIINENLFERIKNDIELYIKSLKNHGLISVFREFEINVTTLFKKLNLKENEIKELSSDELNRLSSTLSVEIKEIEKGILWKK